MRVLALETSGTGGSAALLEGTDLLAELTIPTGSRSAQTLAPTIEALLARGDSVETQIEYAQLQSKTLDALFKLPPRQRAVIVQRYYLEMSEKEMAETLDIAPGTVKWLLNAARSRLRSMLGVERSAE